MDKNIIIIIMTAALVVFFHAESVESSDCYKPGLVYTGRIDERVTNIKNWAECSEVCNQNKAKCNVWVWLTKKEICDLKLDDFNKDEVDPRDIISGKREGCSEGEMRREKRKKRREQEKKKEEAKGPAEEERKKEKGKVPTEEKRKEEEEEKKPELYRKLREGLNCGDENHPDETDASDSDITDEAGCRRAALHFKKTFDTPPYAESDFVCFAYKEKVVFYSISHPSDNAERICIIKQEEKEEEEGREQGATAGDIDALDLKVRELRKKLRLSEEKDNVLEKKKKYLDEELKNLKNEIESLRQQLKVAEEKNELAIKEGKKVAPRRKRPRRVFADELIHELSIIQELLSAV